MDQQLHNALELHKRGETKKALVEYEQILKRDHPPLISFLNASSIWRSEQNLKLSISCLKRGLNLYPREAGLWNNLGNCHLDKNDFVLAISSYRQALTHKPSFVDARISLAACLREMGQIHLAYATLRSRYLPSTKNEERTRLLIPIVEAILALCDQDDTSFQPQDLDAFAQLVEAEVHRQVGSDDPARVGQLMTQLWLQVDQLDRALVSRNKLIEDTRRYLNRPDKRNLKLKQSFYKSWHGLSWNLGIKLLKKDNLKMDGIFTSMDYRFQRQAPNAGNAL